MRSGSRSTCPSLVFISMLLLATSSVHGALIPRSGDVLVASNLDEGVLGCPAVAVGSDGAAVTVWGRRPNPYYPGPALSRRVEVDGTVGPEIQVSDVDDAYFPIGVVAIPGGYVAHWTRFALPQNAGTVVRFLDEAGNPTGPERLIDLGDHARVAVAGERLALLTRPSTHHLSLRLIDLQGADVYPPREISAPVETSSDHAVASDGEGGVVVAWVTGGWPYFTLRAQAFDPAGEPRSEPVVISRRAPIDFVRVATAEGKFIVGWSEDTSNRLLLRTFSLAGEPLGRPELPPARGNAWARTRFLDDLLVTPQGLMVVWNSSRFLREYWEDVFAAELQWDWTKATRGTRLHADRLYQQRCGRLATNGKGDWTAVWQELVTTDRFGNEVVVRNEARTFSGP